MKTEIITVHQQIEISYENEEGRKKIREAVQQDTNWIAISFGAFNQKEPKCQALKGKITITP